jgi:hypothetical protein
LAADFRRQFLRFFVVAVLQFELQMQSRSYHSPNDTIEVSSLLKPNEM